MRSFLACGSNLSIPERASSLSGLMVLVTTISGAFLQVSAWARQLDSLPCRRSGMSTTLPLCVSAGSNEAPPSPRGWGFYFVRADRRSHCRIRRLAFTICGTFLPRCSSRRELISRQFRLGMRHASAKAMLGSYGHTSGGHIRSDRNKCTRPGDAGRVRSVLAGLTYVRMRITRRSRARTRTGADAG